MKKILIILFLLFIVSTVEAQWVKIYADSTVTTRAYKQITVAVIADSVINCNLSNTFQKTLADNQRFVIENIGDGQTINIIITNTTDNYTVTWVDPDGFVIRWSENQVPVQTIGAKLDVYTFVRVGTIIFGAVQQDFSPN